MDVQALIPQLGVAGIFALFAWKLYTDMREDSIRRENTIKEEHDERLKESREREEKLMKHLDKQSDINREVSGTLKQIHDRLCNLEEGK